MEIWKDVCGFEGLYQVSNLGNVKVLDRYVDYGNRICHKKERLLKQHYDSFGYLSVKLKDNKQHRVHVLVAQSFLGVRTYPEYEVDHINGIRNDNRLENLRWVTHAENVKHAYELGHGHMGKTGSENYNAKKVTITNVETEEQFKFDCLLDCFDWLKLKTDKITEKNKYSVFYRYNKKNTPFAGYLISF